MNNRLYFSEHSEDDCYHIGYYKRQLKENNLKQVILFLAKRETGTGYFFCKEFQQVGEVGEGCGRLCEKYKPNNGKKGRCKHYGWCYELTADKYILYHNGKLTKATK